MTRKRIFDVATWFLIIAAAPAPLLTLEAVGPKNEVKNPRAGEVIRNTIGMKLAYIPAGLYFMGSTKVEQDEAIKEISAYFPKYKEKWARAESPRHEVEISKAFYMGIHEVTIGQFKQFVQEEGYQSEAEKDGEGGFGYSEAENKFEGRKPQYTWKNTGWKQLDEHPVVNVTWSDAKAFCAWLSKKDNKKYSLPSEAQWEYACRAGTTTAYSSGDDPEALARVGNVADGTAKAKFPDWKWAIKANDGYVFTAPVGQFKGNAYGLFDMHGNVWEWCEDWYEAKYYDNSPKVDPLNSTEAKYRVLRGGSWSCDPRYCRSAFRFNSAPGGRNDSLGFRVVVWSVP